MCNLPDNTPARKAPVAPPPTLEERAALVPLFDQIAAPVRLALAADMLVKTTKRRAKPINLTRGAETVGTVPHDFVLKGLLTHQGVLDEYLPGKQERPKLVLCADCKAPVEVPAHGGPLPKRCKACAPEANREAKRKAERKRREANPEAFREAARAANRKYRAVNPDTVRKIARKSRAANPDAVRSADRAYRARKKAEREAAKATAA